MSKIKAYFSKRRNKTFYLTAASQIIVIVQMFLMLIGKGHLVTETLKHDILLFVYAFLVLLAGFGLINDPTTPGVKDSE
jgi:uncharacterized membrane protein